MTQRSNEKLAGIPMAAPDISEADVQAVAEVVRSGRLALGPKTVAFEQDMAEYIGVKHAVAVSSGTAALHLLVRALNMGPGDEVLVPSFTFAASVNALLYEGAKPVFVDVEPETYNLNPQDLEDKIT
ncbi:DegT/DnrJ/EryC1/StrS family aminotransferase, partial [Oceanithermus desulfurans]